MTTPDRSALRRFGLTSLFWLPVAFFAWWGWSSVLVLPAYLISEWLLMTLWPETFQALHLLARDALQVHFLAYVDGQVVDWATLFSEINPLKYGYGFPLFIGMVMAVPQAPGRQLWLIGLGYLLMMALQVWGIVFESLRNVIFELGLEVMVRPAEAEAAGVLETIKSGRMNPGEVLLAHPMGLPEELVALCYQLGYLILPAVVPIFVWLAMHADFVERVTGRRLSAGKSGPNNPG